MRFYVDNVYIPPGGADCKEVDYCHIGYETADMEDYDGMNWVGKEDFAKFNLKDSLYDAIRNAGMIADKIQFIDLNDDDLREAHAIVEQLMIKLYKTAEKNEKIKAVIADLRNADSKPSDSFFENF